MLACDGNGCGGHLVSLRTTGAGLTRVLSLRSDIPARGERPDGWRKVRTATLCWDFSVGEVIRAIQGMPHPASF